MEFITEQTVRHEQLGILHRPCFHRYAQLELKYATKTQEMIEYKQKAHYGEA
jgi:hypothetical protein